MRKLIALAAIAAFAPAGAEEQQAQPAPGYMQGRPPVMEGSKLKPFQARKTETPPGEIALDRIELPQGFKVELWASGMPGAREQMPFTPFHFRGAWRERPAHDIALGFERR